MMIVSPNGSSYSNAYRELWRFGVLLFLFSIILQFYAVYAGSGLIISLSPILMVPGSLLMTFGTVYLYFSNSSFDNLSGRFTVLSVGSMILGLVLSFVPLLYSSYTYITASALMLVGPVIFAYGLTVMVTQIYMTSGLKTSTLLTIAILLTAGGVFLFYLGKGYTGNIYVSLESLPSISGVYLLFAHAFKKSYNHWKGLGYFNTL